MKKSEEWLNQLNDKVRGSLIGGAAGYGQVILIYCRSGRRSKDAAQKLADMGYWNVYEFGGIID